MVVAPSSSPQAPAPSSLLPPTAPRSCQGGFGNSARVGRCCQEPAGGARGQRIARPRGAVSRGRCPPGAVGGRGARSPGSAVAGPCSRSCWCYQPGGNELTRAWPWSQMAPSDPSPPAAPQTGALVLVKGSQPFCPGPPQGPRSVTSLTLQGPSGTAAACPGCPRPAPARCPLRLPGPPLTSAAPPRTPFSRKTPPSSPATRGLARPSPDTSASTTAPDSVRRVGPRSHAPATPPLVNLALGDSHLRGPVALTTSCLNLSPHSSSVWPGHLFLLLPLEVAAPLRLSPL